MSSIQKIKSLLPPPNNWLLVQCKIRAGHRAGRSRASDSHSDSHKDTVENPSGVPTSPICTASVSERTLPRRSGLA